MRSRRWATRSPARVVRALWLRPKLREQVARRGRAPADGPPTRLFAARAIRPFYVVGTFDAEAMSQ